jgi:hypothetical protein
MGIQFTNERFLFELVVNWNMIGYVHKNKQWERETQYHYYPTADLEITSGTDELSRAIFFNEFLEEKILLHSISFKMAYRLKTFSWSYRTRSN